MMLWTYLETHLCISQMQATRHAEMVAIDELLAANDGDPVAARLTE